MPEEIDPLNLPTGTRILEYEIHSRIGDGGMGVVYKVFRGGKAFALKLSLHKLSDLSPEQWAQADARARREVSTLAALSHPNIIQVHGFDRWPDPQTGHFYIVTDFVEGDRLDKWRRIRKPPLTEIARVFLRLAEALQEMHLHEVFHRDIKSENIIVRPDGEPVIIDFGIARLRSAHTLTSAGGLMGTPTHLTPEYCEFFLSCAGAKGERYVYRATDDLYALGFVLYEVLTGLLPFESTTDEWGLIQTILTKVPAHPKLLNGAVPQVLDEMAMKLLQKQAGARYQTARQLADALRTALEMADDSWTIPSELPARFPPSPVSPHSLTAKGTRLERPIGGSDLSENLDELLYQEHSSPPVLVRSAGSPRLPHQPETPSVAAADAAGSKPETTAVPFRMVTAERMDFVPPDAPVASPAGAPTSSHSVDPALVEATIKLGRGRDKRLSGKTLLLGGVVSALLLILVAVALTSKSRDVRGKPESILAKFEQAQHQEQQAMKPISTDEKTEETESAFALPPPASGEVARKDRQSKNKPKRGKSGDAAAIDALLAASYGRPTIPSGTSDAGTFVTAEKRPSWVKGVEVVAVAPPPAVGRRGAPFGAHIQAQLRSNLDSRTIGNGVVEAILTRPFAVHGNIVLPSRTMVYGHAQVQGGRFIVNFNKLRLPDDTELPFSGHALDLGDGKPGLAASRRIAGATASQEGVGTAIAKNSASVLLGKVTGDTPGDLASSAGRTALSHTDSSGDPPSQDALLLDAGDDFSIFVKEAF